MKAVETNLAEPTTEDVLVQTNPVVHRQYRKSIRELTQQIEREAKSPSDNTKRAIVLSCGILLSQIVMSLPFAFKPGLKTVYASVLMKSLWKLLSNVRQLRADISKEIRQLLYKGPERYYLAAIAELAALRPTRK